jgi:hypothetical protein
MALSSAMHPPGGSPRTEVFRAWGERWLRQGATALLLVRSVLVPASYNVLIHPRHSDPARIAPTAAFHYPLDARVAGHAPPMDGCPPQGLGSGLAGPSGSARNPLAGARTGIWYLRPEAESVSAAARAPTRPTRTGPPMRMRSPAVTTAICHATGDP